MSYKHGFIASFAFHNSKSMHHHELFSNHFLPFLSSTYIRLKMIELNQNLFKKNSKLSALKIPFQIIFSPSGLRQSNNKLVIVFSFHRCFLLRAFIIFLFRTFTASSLNPRKDSIYTTFQTFLDTLNALLLP